MDSSTGTDSRPAGINKVARARYLLVRWLLRQRLVRAALLYTGSRGPVLADAVTYRALFSVFAGVLLGFSLAALWLTQDDGAWEAVVGAVDAAIPGLLTTAGGAGIVDPDTIRAPTGLSVAGAISLAGLIGSALGAISSLRTAIRTVTGTVSADVAWYLVVLRNLLLAALIGLSFAGAAALTFSSGVLVGTASDVLGVPDGSAVAFWTTRVLSLLVVLSLNAVLVAAAFRILSGVRASARALWSGALLGAIALLVLQELSGLFVGGARANPLLASFASLLALLLWLNLSTQVILLASAFITVSVREEHDRVASRFGAETFAEAALYGAEQNVRTATVALRAAQRAVAEERDKD
ncbi:YhjD/YihY/BrkB family envelope integrity protein [Microbacterium esteraromaticum]|uniref:YhjD/YihY/BrkB family envelope integrity protein n=1 Tax=Microbacterium esteraromaticum TaxID=57043 RepID=UPI002367AA88|nr:YhjD/YihY/BrkB family envelope integrity protein [Microbacterium esteraromaticum]WDH79904.1 YhjD/YihY/BrkB family envelope integrity protein [Microbacterium esteraromaticum]